MINTMIKTKSDCCGCGACASACPVGCITMQPDSEGFLYPDVDESKCINCKKCVASCPSLTKPIYKQVQKCYAVYCNDDDIRKNSSSGGSFTLMAQYILGNDSVVCGAAFDTDWSVKHIVIDDIAHLPKLQKSKYVQSKIYTVLPEIKQNLEAGKQVLFVGTPCQVNALNTYLGKDYDNLYLVDIVCHGVPSPTVWQKYLAQFDSVQRVDFRDKTNSWQKYSTSIDYLGGKYSVNYANNPYMTLFLYDLILRPSCYNCFSKYPNKTADITLGDFWGIDNVLPQMNDDKGISAVIINSEKGQSLFDNIKKDVTYKEVDFDSISKGNPSLSTACCCPQKRDDCMLEINETQNVDFKRLAKKYTTPSMFSRMKGAVRYYLKKL